MGHIIYSATGCTRCKIVKKLMDERGIAFTEYDMKADGKDEFQQFYKANRKAVFRGPDGVEFPIIYDGQEIRQGIAASVAYLLAGIKLDGFFSVGTLHKEWVDGIHVSGGDAAYSEEFLVVLRYLKKNNLKLQLETKGKNSSILKQIQAEALADRIIMNVLGPRELYGAILGTGVNVEDVSKSMTLAASFPEYKFQTTVVPIAEQQEEEMKIRYLKPEEVAATAKFIEEATGSKKNSYLIKLFKPSESKDERFKVVEPMEANALLKYRSMARAYQVMTEIEK